MLTKMKNITITNDKLMELITLLENKAEEKDSALLARLADDLKRPLRIKREVNISKINRFTKDGEVIVVPGKVLGGGELDHKVTISAFKFSSSALAKLEKNGSKIVPLAKLAEESINGKRIRIIG
jgi:large subunit ribosomal protein L18e